MLAQPTPHETFIDLVEKWNQQVQQSPNPKWVYYSTEISRLSGGFADRLIGVMNAFVFAIHAGRAFGVEWKKPDSLNRFLPFRLNAPEMGKNSVDITCQGTFDQCKPQYIQALLSDSPVIRLSSNQNWIDDVTRYDIFADDVYAKYHVRVDPVLMKDVFGLLFRELFNVTTTSTSVEEYDCVQLRTG